MTDQPGERAGLHDAAPLGAGGLLGRPLRPLLDQRDTTVQAMIDAVQDEVADYRTFGTADEEAEWAEGLGSLLDLFLSLASEDRWLTAVEGEAIRSIGAKRAQQGFTSAAVRASVRAAVGAARTRIINEYEPAGHDDRAAMQRVLELLHRFSGTVEDLLQDGHTKRLDDLRARGGEGVGRLIHEILDGVVLDDATFAARAAVVGCDPAVNRAIFLADDSVARGIGEAAARGELHAQLVRRIAPVEHTVVLVSVPLHGTAQVVRDRIGQLARQEGTTVLYLGLWCRAVDVHCRYVSAVDLMPHLPKLGHPGGVIDADEVTMLRLAAALPKPVRVSLLHEVFGAISSLGQSEAAWYYDAIALFVRHDFRTPGIRAETGRDRKTVYGTRDKLATVTGRSLLEKANQTVIAITHAVHLIES